MNFKTILLALGHMILSIILLLFQFKYHSTYLILYIILELSSFLICMQQDNKKDGLKLTYLTIFTSIILGYNALIISLIPIIKLQTSLLFMGDIILTCVCLVSLINSDVRTNVSEIYTSLPKLNEINLKSNKNKISEEDVILGYKMDIEGTYEKTYKLTNEPVILPAEDRFLHMLIIGPTGSGKTSQTLIPMTWRDIQIKESKVGVTVIEPKGDFAEKVYAMVQYYNENMCSSEDEKKTVIYFNPILKDCPFFNPLMGTESDVIENMASTFNRLNADSSTYFKDMGEGLVRRSIKVLKRLFGDEATFIDFNKLIWNVDDEGRKLYISPLQHLTTDINGRPLPESIKEENKELVDWFLNDYFPGKTGQRGTTKTYENTSAIRTQVTKIISNEYLKKVLNPPKNIQKVHKNVRCNISAEEQRLFEESKHILRLNFDEALENGDIITISTAQGALNDLGKFLGYFIILQLQASVFRRPGTEYTRVHNMLYIDEFQEYANPGFGRMLTQGRSYRVASHLATQARDQVADGRDGRNFLSLVSANARNKIIYPGISYIDAEYYSKEFGDHYVSRENKTYSKSQYLSTIKDKKVSIRDDEKMERRFSASDIMNLKFGQITHQLVVNKSVAEPGVAQIEYIPKEINKKLDEMILEDKRNREIVIDEVVEIIEEPEIRREFNDPAATDNNKPEDIKHNEDLFNFIEGNSDDEFDDF